MSRESDLRHVLASVTVEQEEPGARTVLGTALPASSLDGEEPGLEIGVGRETIPGADGAQAGLLGQVLGVVRVVAKRERESAEARCEERCSDLRPCPPPHSACSV